MRSSQVGLLRLCNGHHDQIGEVHYLRCRIGATWEVA